SALMKACATLILRGAPPAAGCAGCAWLVGAAAPLLALGAPPLLGALPPVAVEPPPAHAASASAATTPPSPDRKRPRPPVRRGWCGPVCSFTTPPPTCTRPVCAWR